MSEKSEKLLAELVKINTSMLTGQMLTNKILAESLATQSILSETLKELTGDDLVKITALRQEYDELWSKLEKFINEHKNKNQA